MELKNSLPLLYFSPFSLLHTIGFSSLFLWPTCFSGTKFLSQQSFKLGSKTHARQSPFTPAVQRAMQWSNPYQSVCHLYLLYYIIFILFIFIFVSIWMKCVFGTWTGISVAPGISPPGKSKKPISHPIISYHIVSHPQLRVLIGSQNLKVIKWLVCESNQPAQFYSLTMVGTCWQRDTLNLPLI